MTKEMQNAVIQNRSSQNLATHSKQLTTINGATLLALDIELPRFIVANSSPLDFICLLEALKSVNRGWRCGCVTKFCRAAGFRSLMHRNAERFTFHRRTLSTACIYTYR